jgi:hypothetical protein
MFFSGISEMAQVNFSRALIFWLLLYQDKSNKEKTLFDEVIDHVLWYQRSTIIMKKACPVAKHTG